MQIRETNIHGCYLIEPKKIEDKRGYFARAWCSSTLVNHGLNGHISQSNMAVSKYRGTLRGLHFQLPPHDEVKIVRCVRGTIFDVVVDLREDSKTHCEWMGVELSPDNALALYVPKGCATGYQTLTDDVEMYYHTSAAYAPDHARGVRFDDPRFGITWPIPPSAMSDQDRLWPDYAE